MIIICPECASQFLVKRSEFGSEARKVRCSNCGYAWQQPVVDDQPRRRPAARTANRLSEVPPEPARPVDQGMAKEPDVAGGDEISPADSAIDPAPNPADTGSRHPEGEAPGGSEETSEEVDTDELTLAETDTDETEKTSADDAIDFEGEDTDASQSETVNDAEPQSDSIDGDKQPEPEPTDAQADTSADAKPSSKFPWRRWAIPAAAAASVVLVIGGLVLARDGIVHMFPGLAGAYEAVGLAGHAVVGAGLEFQHVTSRREWSGPEEVLIVHGKIANVTDGKVEVPMVRVALYDVDDSEVQAVTIANALHTISPGELIPFEARIPSPAMSAQRIRVSFDAAEAESPSHDAHS